MFSKLRMYFKRIFYLLPVLVVLVAIIGGLTYLVGTIGSDQPNARTVATVIATIPPPALGTPIAPYAGLDPSIVDYLDSVQFSQEQSSLGMLGVDIQPIGVYLPFSPATTFIIGQPTTLPTPLPYPTSPPLPLPGLAQVVLPTVVVVEEDGTERTEPYVVAPGTECGPEGNPVQGLLTQYYHSYHGGIDIALPLGSPVLATHSGQISFAGWSDVGYGYLVILQSGAFITYYAHNTSFNVTEGQFVGKGSIIAWSGSTGNSSGPHVHYETRINDVPVDPLTFHTRGHGTC